MLEFGPHEQNIIKQAIRHNLPLPESIQNAPKLRLGLELYIGAFFDLTSERQVGFGFGPIPWTSIVGYGKLYNFDEVQMENLLYFVRELDSAHLKYLNDKAEAK